VLLFETMLSSSNFFATRSARDDDEDGAASSSGRRRGGTRMKCSFGSSTDALSGVAASCWLLLSAGAHAEDAQSRNPTLWAGETATTPTPRPS